MIRVKDFTEREILILNMLCNGKTIKEIADTIFCSEETIKKFALISSRKLMLTI
ncbi:MAG: LuxR C-terminal-related transcriptional regulator [Candidatus Aphodosoma sp.]